MLLASPLLVEIVWPNTKALSTGEARELAAAPSFPVGFKAWIRLPEQLDGYFRDHFGLRDAFIRADALLSRNLHQNGNDSVLIGDNGRMFYLGDEMVRQSAGLVLRVQKVDEVADMLAAMKSALAARGAHFLVASPPNSATIYEDQLPIWARNRGRRTEYDAFLDDLAARGVPAMDMRPALRAAREQGNVYYMHDTHWTPRGEVAGFNAVVEAAGHPDWRLDATSALGPPVTRRGGDLARMLGLGDDVPEPDQELTLPSGKRELLSPEPFGTYVETVDRPGPTIMIIGDSFTEGLFAPMLLQHAARVVWVYHRFCGFDWKWIDQFRPDDVWWMPTERSIPCGAGVRPSSFPRDATARQ
ncbi:MAG TPA: hypothetical protein VGH40_15250 [Roseiarcus sp.]